ncbi:MAG: hypothetical protein JW910_09315 [Anaerolineae bacterium]|nr:hypothetical protein [Anaerolineae bacterium]
MTYHILIPDGLTSAGMAVLEVEPAFRVTLGSLPRAEAIAAAADADALIVRSATKVDAEFLAAAPQLKVIARAGVGVDNVDLAAAGARGIAVMNTPGGNTNAAAEHTLALMLALARHVPVAHQSLRDGRWDRKKYMGTELRGKTLGVIGLGRIGQTVAALACAFGMTVLAYDPKQEATVFECCEVTPVSFDELLARSDYITLHAPATDETREMINAETIARMKDGVRIINTARGVLVDSEALAAAIISGKVTAAALDVYAVEPPGDDHPLVGLDRVVHTPHLGASTVEAQIAVGVQAAEQVRDALMHGEYRNVVNGDYLKTPAG